MRLASIVAILLAVTLGCAVTSAQTNSDTPSGVRFTGGLGEHRDPYIEGSWDTPPAEAYVSLEVYRDGDTVVGVDWRSAANNPNHAKVLFNFGRTGNTGVNHAIKPYNEAGCSITRISLRLSKNCLKRYYDSYNRTWGRLRDGYLHEGKTYEIRLQFRRYVPRQGSLPDEKVVTSSAIHYITVPAYVPPTATPTPTPNPTATRRDDPQPTPCATAVAIPPAPTPEPPMSIPELFDQDHALISIWRWKNESKGWIGYNAGSESGYLYPGTAYFFLVARSTTIGKHNLTCTRSPAVSGAGCLNLVAW